MKQEVKRNLEVITNIDKLELPKSGICTESPVIFLRIQSSPS